MAEKLKNPPGSTFDFGPFAGEYENWYATPEGQAHDLVQQKDVLALLNDVPSRGRLLEVGCGTGHWSRFFWSLGFEVHGTDVSEEMICEAKRTVPQCSFGRADAEVLPAPDGSYDIVASVAALEFIPDPAAAVREMARCTRPGGTILIGTLNRTAPINRDRILKGEEPYASGHLFAPEDLANLLKPFGEVRMAASPVDGGSAEPRIFGEGDLPRHGGSLQGSLLVAAVKCL